MRHSWHGAQVPLIVGGATVAFTGALLPVARLTLSPVPSFVPMVLAVVACFDLLSVFMLVSDYLDRGEVRLLATGCAFAWSLVVMVGYALAFPGVLPHPPLATTDSVAPWLYVCWHTGFPVVLALSWIPWPKITDRLSRTDRRATVAAVSLVLILVTGAALVAAVVVEAPHLPVLIEGMNTTRMTTLTAPVAIPLALLALVLTSVRLRRHSGPERWVPVTILVCLCDLVLTYVGDHRFGLGWYAGRALTALAAGLVLAALLHQFREFKHVAEKAALTDSLTGLANRRLLQVVLDREVVRAARYGGGLSVIALDLDGFKGVNDRDGHQAGDRVLIEAAATWSSLLRAADLLARVGGDEFVAVLVQTDEVQAAHVSEKLRGATPAAVGVSLGSATYGGLVSTSSDLMSLADLRMYAEKREKYRQSGAPPLAVV
jgi:diguanylate cyclase (GGDEF)-like protein